VQSLYSITWEYYRRQFPALLGNRKDPFAELLRGLAQPGIGHEEEPVGFRERLAKVVVFPGVRRGGVDPAAEPVDRRTFTAAGKAQRESLSSLVEGLVRHLRRGRLAESLSALTHLAPLALSAAPYLVALQAQHKDADLLEMAARRFLGRSPEGDRSRKTAWFTDAPAETGGAEEMIRALRSAAGESGGEWTVLACGRGKTPPDLPMRSFAALLELPLPGDGSPPLRVPPILEMLDTCERERYSEIVISTPGPVGLAGLAAGKLLGIRRTALVHAGFHDDLLRYLAGSPALEELAWAYLRWFCGAMDRVCVESRAQRDLLVKRGIEAGRLELLDSLPAVYAQEPLLVEAMV
jgi:hypothetical protein